MMVLDFGATLFGELDALLPIFARDVTRLTGRDESPEAPRRGSG